MTHEKIEECLNPLKKVEYYRKLREALQIPEKIFISLLDGKDDECGQLELGRSPIRYSDKYPEYDLREYISLFQHINTAVWEFAKRMELHYFDEFNNAVAANVPVLKSLYEEWKDEDDKHWESLPKDETSE